MQVERVPVRRHVVRQTLVDPQRQAAAQQRPRDDVELEDVGQLVRDQAIEGVVGLVDRQDHAIAVRLGERQDAFRQLAGLDVLLLELALRLVEHERHFEGEVMLEVGADSLIRAFGIAHDPLEMLLDLRVVIDLEVIGRVDVPVERVVADLVLAVVGHVARLRGCVVRNTRAEDQGQKSSPHQRDGAARIARAHDSPRKWQRKAGCRRCYCS